MMNRNSFIAHVERAYLTTHEQQKVLPTIVKKLDEKNIISRYVQEQNSIDQKFHNNRRLRIQEMTPHFELMKELTREIHDIIVEILKKGSALEQKHVDSQGRVLQKI